MKLSNSKVARYRRCPKAYEFDYVMKIEPKAKNIFLERGSWLHTLLEVYYAQDPNKVIEIEERHRTRRIKVGKDWRKAHAALTKAFNRLFDEEKEELGDLPAECERIMLGYVERWEEEDEQEETIAVELDEWVTLPDGNEFNFIIDRVLVKSDGGVWLRDYKTVSSFMDPDFMLIDAQLARYFWAFPRIPEFRPLAKRLRGVEFDELRTKAPTVPSLVNAPGHSAKNPKPKVLTQRADLDTDYRTYLQAIKDNKLKPADYKEILQRLKRDGEDKFFRRTILPKDKPLVRQMMLELMQTAAQIKTSERRGHFPRTPDKSCTWGCSFYEPCMAQLHGADISDIVDLKYQPKKKRRKPRGR